MALFTWTSHLELGVPEMDTEHVRLFNLADRLHADLGQGTSGEVLRARFAELLDHLRAHFASEEELMLRSGYPELADHREEHRRISEGALQLQSGFSAGQTSYSSRMLLFLRDALHGHIHSSDLQFARHLLERPTAGRKARERRSGQVKMAAAVPGRSAERGMRP